MPSSSESPDLPYFILAFSQFLLRADRTSTHAAIWPYLLSHSYSTASNWAYSLSLCTMRGELRDSKFYEIRWENLRSCALRLAERDLKETLEMAELRSNWGILSVMTLSESLPSCCRLAEWLGGIWSCERSI